MDVRRTRRRAAAMLVTALAALSLGAVSSCSRDGRDMQPPGAAAWTPTAVQPR